MSPAPSRHGDLLLALPLSRGEARTLALPPRLLKALARGDRHPAPHSLAEFLFTQFDCAAARQPGIAALTALADGVDTRGRDVLRLDPVHLRPDRGRLFLISADHFALDEGEADAIIAALNESGLPDGAVLLRGRSPCRWYLLGGDPAAASAVDPAAASGASVDTLEPSGPASLAWHRALNEIQMCLHQLAVNEDREAAGQPPVNSVWLWGAGAAPADVSSRFVTVVATDPLAAGLGMAAGARVLGDLRAGTLRAACEAGQALVVAPAAAAAAALESAVSFSGPRRGRALSLWMPGCTLNLAGASRLRLWRRLRPLTDYLAGEDHEDTTS